MPGQKDYEAFLTQIKTQPPVDCEFSVGDTVVFTNEYGVSFPGLRVIGFADDDSFYGRFIHLNTGAWWFPVRPGELTLDAKPGPGEGIF